MKSITLALALNIALFSSHAALANADDAKWVARCVTDNQAEKAAIEVVSKYCVCMNNKMSVNETQSITQWEKTHAT
jgi:hypothetical protein